jgi:hypothetical protein
VQICTVLDERLAVQSPTSPSNPSRILATIVRNETNKKEGEEKKEGGQKARRKAAYIHRDRSKLNRTRGL